MIYYFKKILVLSIVMLCITSFPIQGFAQNPDTATLQEEKQLPKSEIKFKGWFFGVMVGTEVSGLNYEAPFGKGRFDKYGYTGNYYASMNNKSRSFFQLNAKYVAANWFTIDFANTVKADEGNIMLYKEGRQNWLFGYYDKEPYQEYSFNLTNYQFLATPTITIGSGVIQWNVGVPVGFLVVLQREGTLDKSFETKSRAGLLGISTGINCKFLRGILSAKIEGITSSNLGSGDWYVWTNYWSVTTGYALPLSAFQKKTKISTL